MNLCSFNAFLLFALGIVFVGEIVALSEHQIAGIDGLRCDSCGQECSIVCGSRQFRTCCFNYIKKRSDPSLPSGSTGGQGSEDSPTSHGSSPSEHLQITPGSIQSSRFGSRNLRRSIGGSFSGLTSDLVSSPSLTLDSEDIRWLPYLNREIYNRLEDDRHSNNFRLN